MPRIATYLRAQNPVGPNSAPAQRAAFASWLAARPNFSVVHAFEDLDEHAGPDLKRRPGWRALQAAVERGEVDGLLVASGDRICRDREQYVGVVLGLHRRGIEVWTASDSRPLARQMLELLEMVNAAAPGHR